MSKTKQTAAAIVIECPEGMELGPLGGAPMVCSKEGSNTPKGRGEKIHVFKTLEAKDPSTKHFKTMDAPCGENWLSTSNSKNAAPASPNWVANDHSASGPMSKLCTPSIHSWFHGDWNNSSPVAKRMAIDKAKTVWSLRDMGEINNMALRQASSADGMT
jgi:hypothetical protein